MKAISSTDTLVTIYQTTRGHNPDDKILHGHRRENLQSHGRHIIRSFYVSFLHAILCLDSQARSALPELGSDVPALLNFPLTLQCNPKSASPPVYNDPS
jgi:hypothetical protein